MKKSVKDLAKELVKNHKYFCNFGWRWASFQEIRNNDRGKEVAIFKDVCDQLIACETADLARAINWSKSYNK